MALSEGRSVRDMTRLLKMRACPDTPGRFNFRRWLQKHSGSNPEKLGIGPEKDGVAHMSPMNASIMVGRFDAMRALLDAGADPNAPSTMDLLVYPHHGAFACYNALVETASDAWFVLCLMDDEIRALDVLMEGGIAVPDWVLFVSDAPRRRARARTRPPLRSGPRLMSPLTLSRHRVSLCNLRYSMCNVRRHPQARSG